MKYELQNVISGKGEVIYGNAIQAVASHLKGSTGARKLVKESEFFRKQETEILIEYITTNDLWVKEIKVENYVSQGAEQKVYLKDGKSVLKLNDAIFYASWTDYFHNLLIQFFMLRMCFMKIKLYKEYGSTIIYTGIRGTVEM